MGMRYLWRALNSIAVALSFRGGYVSLDAERLRRTNPDAVHSARHAYMCDPDCWIFAAALEYGPTSTALLGQKSIQLVACPTSRAFYFDARNGRDCHRRRHPEAYLRFSRILDDGRVRMLRHWTIRGTDSGIPDLSTTNRSQLAEFKRLFVVII
jgi:hypothetical protein